MKRITLAFYLILCTGLNNCLTAGFWDFKRFLKEPPASKLRLAPIVYHENYNISVGLLDKLHPFDGKKYGKVAQNLMQTCGVKYYRPEMVTDADLLLVHTPEYLESLKSSATVAKIVEVLPAAYIPNFILQRYLLNSMRLAVTGTIMATNLALEHGWAVNLSGGYHHAKAGNGEGFCVFADIPLAIKKARETRPDLKVLIVDLDAHQGNGFEMILKDDALTKIFDIYSDKNYPMDLEARQYITYNYPVKHGITTEEYLTLLKTELPKALEISKPDLIIYNAGTDIFENDRLGRMSVSEEGLIERDAFVFKLACDNKIPVAMVLSGGYTQDSARIISRSLENIIKTILPTITIAR